MRRFSLILTGIVLVIACLRLPLLDAPMERDEGEYATMGLGMLRGTPPYQETYTMKWPGTAAMYALIFKCLGPTTRALHAALLIINGLAVILVALTGRRLLGARAGLFAGAAYGTLTLGLGLYGPWLSAEHFAVMFLLSGIWVLPSSPEDKHAGWRLGLGCLLLGLAPVLKQHAAFPAGAWLLAAMHMIFNNPVSPRSKRWLCMAVMSTGFILPAVVTCALMKLCGVFSTFWFWTVIYASQYASAVPLSTGWEYFKIGAGQAAA
ncbi:MAG: glycosyltransferase family 39 protein, partial [Verrucomicrobiae bacterium]|nr:glycosyltransferase family 39 protein [Verrucomicrobiae bacterium]